MLLARCCKSLALIVFMGHLFLSCLHAQTFTATGGLNEAREGHTATLLGNGTVLIAGGGLAALGQPVAAAEIYDPTKGAFVPTVNLNHPRQQHTATLLTNGKVLIVGGYGSTSVSDAAEAELYDPATGNFENTGLLNTARWNHTATLLNDGTVLITGGQDKNSNILSSAEIYNPSTGVFTTIAAMKCSTIAATSTLLPNGQVLIAGGFNSSAKTCAELYNPATLVFTLTGSLLTGRSNHTATLLNNGSVLMSGGITGSGSTVTATSELYNPTTGTFTNTGSMVTARDLHTATALADGTVLVTGGSNGLCCGSLLATAEIYNPTSGTFSATGSLSTAQFLNTATAIGPGQVLVAGGENSSQVALSSAQIYAYKVISGFVDPKFIVVGVVYAPPGKASTVNYGTSTMIGTNTSSKNAFKSTETLTATECLSVGGAESGCGGSDSGVGVSLSETTSFSQENETSASYAINKTSSYNIISGGPQNTALGVDHDFDTIYVWFNPMMNLIIPQSGSTILNWTGYSYNTTDPNQYGQPDILGITVYCLKNPYDATCEANYGVNEARAWDTSGTGALTLADYASILSTDPFVANPNYNPEPTVDKSGRFDSLGQNIQYPVPNPGFPPITTMGNLTVSSTTTLGKGATNTYSVGVGIDLSSTADFILGIADKISLTETNDWTNTWSKTDTDTTTQTATYSVTGPASTDNYLGPKDFDVYKDNVYGSFMFYSALAVNIPAASITASPTSISFTSTVGGTSAPVVLTLTNDSTVTMTMQSPVVAFSDTHFSIVSGSDHCSGMTLAANATCQVSIQFKPTTVTTINGNLIAGGNENAPSSNTVLITTAVSLTGTATQPQTATPVPSLRAGSYSGPQQVTLSDTTSGAVIYYTTNGTTPTTASTKYTGAITVSTTETLKAIAVATGYTNSAVLTAAYTITAPTVAAPGFSCLLSGTERIITITDSTAGAKSYYTITEGATGTTPSSASTLYAASFQILNALPWTIEAIAEETGYTNSKVTTQIFPANSGCPLKPM